MNWMIRHGGLWLLLLTCWLPTARGQSARDRISQIVITNIGPAVASDDFIRANIHVKAGDVYNPRSLDQDVRALNSTGLFTINITVDARQTDDGVVLTFVLPGRPRVTGIDIEGNTNLSRSKLLKKVTTKVNEPFEDLKMFNDSREMEKLYEKAGYAHTEVRYEMVNLDRAQGRTGVLFHVKEAPRYKIESIRFTGAQAYSQRKLRAQLKTKQHWMFSWVTGSDRFKEDQFSDDQDALREFYQKAGYIDFEIKEVRVTHPTPGTMAIEFMIYEGTPYRVGSIKFDGTTLMPTNVAERGFRLPPEPPKKPRGPHDEWLRERVLQRSFLLKMGDIFKPQLLKDDLEAVEDYYGSKGYLRVPPDEATFQVAQIPNTQTGTMDLEFHVHEGHQSVIEKIEITGNIKTKDRVIRRELFVSPGEVFDMVRVKASQDRVEQLSYFTPKSVSARPESDPTLPPESKNLIISVEEQSTGNMSAGAGYNTVQSVFVFFSVEQRNFDLFKPPYFTGAGQKFRLSLQLGTQFQDYEVSFQEPWFLNRKLTLDVGLYRSVFDYQSLDNLYNEGRTGIRAGLTRALGSDRLIGGVNYNLEEVEIFHVNTNAPDEFLRESGSVLLNRFGVSLAYDTRNNVGLPTGGQRTSLTSTLTLGDRSYVKSEVSTAWYFPGVVKGHVLELVGRAGVAQKLGDQDIPFYDRYYLGGLRDLRGFDYRAVGPRAVTQDGTAYEPIGGDTYWMGSAEYSIPIVLDNVRFAIFYDIGNVSARAWNNSGFDVQGRGAEGTIGPVQRPSLFNAGNTGVFSDNFGFGIHLDIPNLGPLRLDYGIPIHHDGFSSGGKFQFGVGFTRPL